jgi:hypothetical protein
MLSDLAKEPIEKITQLNYSRAFLITTKSKHKYIYKNDVDNEKNVKTNDLLLSLGLKAPKNILLMVPFTIWGDQYLEEPSTVQIIEYIPKWKNFTLKEAKEKVDNLPRQIAEILAFDLLVGNSDRFLFITRYIDNIFFKDDPEYDQMYLWDDPIVNDGNIGIVNDELWTLDCIFSEPDMIEFLKKLTDEQLKDIEDLMIKFMEFNEKDSYYFRHYFKMYRQKFSSVQFSP